MNNETIKKRLDNLEKTQIEQEKKISKIEEFIDKNKLIFEKIIEEKKLDDEAWSDYLKEIKR